jgi:hypothetical protein
MDEKTVVTATIPSEHSEPSQTEVVPNECAEPHLQEETFCLPVKFNKQDYQLSKEEATAYAQKGMKFDTIEPMLDKLKGLAQQNGVGLGELVDALCEGPSEQPKGGVEERLAEEFLLLQEECPDITAFEQLPRAVVEQALADGESLLLSYLRYYYREGQRVSEAKASAARAGAASAGSQRGEPPQLPDPAMEAMMRGVRG